MEENITIEERLDKIEEIISELSNSELPLDQAFKKYEEGLKLMESCSGEFEKLDEQFEVLNKKYNIDTSDEEEE